MKSTLLFFLIIGSILCGCAKNVSPNTYTTDEVGVVSRVKHGVVIAKRIISIDSNGGNTGGAAGVVGGAALGSMVGKNVATSIAGAVGGALIAGSLGHGINKAVNHHTGYEYIIKLADGKTVSVTQEKSVQLAIKQPVLIIYGIMTRVVPDNT